MPRGATARAIRWQAREREVTTIPRLAEDDKLALRLPAHNRNGQ
jgi:hypothetical protein